MANVKYYLDKGNILLSYFVTTGDVVRLSIKEKVDPKHWDHKKCRARSSYKYANKLNRLMDDLDMFVKDIRIDYKMKGLYLDGNILKKEIQQRLYGNKSGLVSEYAETIFLSDKSGKVKPQTLATYKASIEVINKCLPSLSFNDVNRMATIKLEKSMKDAGYSVNYINRIFKVFHNIVKNAYIDGIHENKYYMSTGFVPGTEEVDNVYLTIQELDHIYNSLSTLSDRNRNAAIIFLRGCYTGQRFQTYKDFHIGMIYTFKGVDMISLKHGKTSNQVSIPISDKMKTVMAMDVHPISRQKLADYIKDVCKVLEISKWEKVGTHTARRTFATNMVLAGVDISKIMKITGHKTEQEFRKYVKIDHVQSAVSVIDEVNAVFGKI